MPRIHSTTAPMARLPSNSCGNEYVSACSLRRNLPRELISFATQQLF